MLHVDTILEPHREFADLLPVDTQDQRTRLGIIPDIVVIFDGDKVIGDVKVIGDNQTWSTRYARNPRAPRSAVEKRQANVHSSYASTANKLDRDQGHGDPTCADVHRTPFAWYRDPAHFGPIRRRLQQLRLHGLVAGPRGEISSDFTALIKKAIDVGLPRMNSLIATQSYNAQKAMVTWHSNCRIGMAIQRCSARHVLERIGYAGVYGQARAAYDDVRISAYASDMMDAYHDMQYRYPNVDISPDAGMQ